MSKGLSYPQHAVHFDREQNSEKTYIFITFLLLKVAVCETSSAFSIRNKLAERSQRIYFQQVLKIYEHINSIRSM